MRQRFGPSEQCEGDFVDSRIDALRLHSGAYFRELLVSRDAKYLDRFRPIAGSTGRRQLHDPEDHGWESED